MRIEVQVRSECVANYQDHDARAELLLRPILQDARGYGGKIVEQAPILLKDGPEHIWHGKADARKGNVWKHSCNFTLPGERCSLPAARTGPGLASMREGLPLSVVGCVDLSPQRKGPAVEHFLEVLSDHMTCLCIVPVGPIVGQYLLDGRFGGVHLNRS